MCPRLYQWRYVNKFPSEARSVNLVIGSALHEALATFYETLRRKEPEPNLDTLHEVFVEKLRAELSGVVPVLLGDKETTESLELLGRELLATFIDGVDRPNEVLEVESPFIIEIPGARRRLVGVFDAVVKMGGRTVVLEHKSCSKAWSTQRVETDSQCSAYAMAAPMLGFGEAQVVLQMLIKTKTAAFKAVPVERCAADIADFCEMVVNVEKAIDAGVSFPNRDWQCRSCEYASRCVAG
jgi:putative RecB family exonuclease